MKKNIIAAGAVLALLFTASASHALRWGAEFSGVAGKMDGKDLSNDMAYQTANPGGGEIFGGNLKQDKSAGLARLFVEGRAKWSLGLAAGFGTMPGMTYTTWSGSYNAFMDKGVFEGKASYIPVDLYLKYRPRDSKFSLSAGAGADYIAASAKVKDDLDGAGNPQAGSHEGTFTQKKLVSHVQGGAEFFVFKWLSLNVGAKYLFGALFDDLTGNMTEGGVASGKHRLIMAGEKLEASPVAAPLASGERPFRYDFSGLRVSAGLRVYFN